MSLAAVALRRKKRQRQRRGDSLTGGANTSGTVVTPSGLLRLSPSPNSLAARTNSEAVGRRSSAYIPLAQVELRLTSSRYQSSLVVEFRSTVCKGS